jgi:hypothetical protein
MRLTFSRLGDDKLGPRGKIQDYKEEERHQKEEGFGFHQKTFLDDHLGLSI